MPYKDKEKEREKKRRWKRLNPEKVKESNRKYQLKNKEKIKAYRREYSKRPEVRKRRSLKMRERCRKKRLEIIKLLGSKCARCGFDDIRALQIDHVNGNGNQEKKKAKGIFNYYQTILRKIKAGSKDYQLLCANCNWIKKYENREWGYKYE